MTLGEAEEFVHAKLRHAERTKGFFVFSLEETKLTFCIQGPLVSSDGSPIALQLYESVTRFFPESEVVISSWEEHERFQFPGPKYVFSVDPGSGLRRLRGPENNINRQITTSSKALEFVDSEFAVKVRSDLLFKNANVLRFLPLVKPEIDKVHNIPIMQGRLVVMDRHTYSPQKKTAVSLPLHISDNFQFGLTEDLRRLWNVPFISYEDEYHLFERARQSDNTSLHIPKYRAEQYFWLESARKTMLDNKWIEDWNGSEAALPFSSEDFMADNIVPVKASTLGLTSQKYSWSISQDLITSTFAFTFLDWERTSKLKAKQKLSRRYIPIEIVGEIYRLSLRGIRAIFGLK